MQQADGTTARAPVAFLSHASEDKAEYAEPLGRHLARLGISPWLDKWEIQPGDSLVQKLFDEGLSQCDAVVVIVSKASVAKKWVREELDAATVSRIENGTRIVPIRLDGVEMPAPLRHLVWIESLRDDAAINVAAGKIADVLHNLSDRPHVGPAPSYVARGFPVPGLRRTDTFLLLEATREAVAHGGLMALDWTNLSGRIEAAGLTGDVLMESVHALAEMDMIDVRLHGENTVLRFSLTSHGYNLAIGYVFPDIDRVRLAVVSNLRNDPPNGSEIIRDLAAKIGAPRLLIDMTLRELEARGLIVVSRHLGNDARLSSVSPTIGRLLD